MGRWQPYMYNAPQRESWTDVPTPQFNPKAVTMASREPQSPPKKKPEGPLINFNQHPDSYLILPYGKTDAKPMNMKHKAIIKYTRWIQLFFRCATLLGAIGVLLCGIFIRGAQDTEGYIMRIPPGVDIATCLYAIYHLLRDAKSRPAGSSASYHFFALVTDAGFIPFYVFTAILSKRNVNLEAGTVGRWRTFFPTDEETDKVLLTTWLTAVTVGGLHLASLFIDLYLALVFRKISHLPADLNPLEENLTSRRKTKHKHKNSSISAVTPLTANEKRFSAQTGTTNTTGNRYSQVDPLIGEKDIDTPDMKRMSFLHTRNDSDMAYSPHTPNSARASKQRFSMYSQPASARQSRVEVNHRDDLLRRDETDEEETLAQRKSLLAQQAVKRNSRPNSFVTASSKLDFYTSPSTAKAEKHDASGDIALRREDLQSDNWFVHDDNDGKGSQNHNDSPATPAKGSMFPSKRQAQGYNTVSLEDISDDEIDAPMMPEPLRMNPPTPPPTKSYQEVKSTPPPLALQRTQTTTSVSSEATFSRSPTRSSTRKSRYYGDLKAATQGIRNSPTQSPSGSPTKGPSRNNANKLPSAVRQYTTNSAAAANNTPQHSPFSLDKKSFASVRRTGEAGYTPVKAQSPRVISRSGVDYEGAYFDDVSDLGTPGRRRDVSGKIAEEGRGGVGHLAERWGGMKEHGLTYRKVSTGVA